MNNKNEYFKNALKESDACAAPLAGVSDLAFRLVCLENHASIMTTEMVSAKGIIYNNKNTYDLLRIDESEKNTGVQLFGSDTVAISEAIKRTVNQTDFAFIDFNMGCPVKKVVNNMEGSGLLKDLELLRSVAKTLVTSSEKPVSVKIRIGFDETNINCIEVAKILEEVGVNLITVHGRTREQFYSGNADWDIIAKVKESVSIPVLANGDVVDVESYLKIKEHTACDGVMIGRATMGNPFIFRQIYEYNTYGEYNPVTNKEKLALALRHFDYILKFKGEKTALNEFRKHLSWYTKGMKGGASLRGKINALTSKDELIEITSSLIDMMVD